MKKQKSGLPTTVVVDVKELYLDADDQVEDTDVMDEILGDYLSDTYGFCIFGYLWKVNYEYDSQGHKYPKSITLSNIEWDTEE